MRKAALILLLSAPAAAAPNFVQEPGVRLSSGVMQAQAGARYYFIEGSTAVFSLTSADGETFTREAGIRLSTFTTPRVEVSSITGLTVGTLNDGRRRMIYSAIGSTGTLFALYGATAAAAGSDWVNDTGTILTSALPIFSPSVVDLQTGDWRLYFVTNNRIFSALSTNEGRNFGAAAQVLSDTAENVSAVLLTDNRVRLYYSSGNVIVSALSTDANGTTFSLETGVRFSTTAGVGSITNPFVARHATETWRWRMYYNFGPTSLSTPSVYSASVHAPEVTGLSPNVLLRANAVQPFTVTGEVFDPAVASVSLNGPSSVIGGAVTQVNDKTLTFTANILLPVGQYNLTVTNPSGQASTLPLALLIDVPGGALRTVDNLFRPLRGGRARVDATIYTAGRLTLKVFTVDGRPIATLFDGEAGEGTTSVFWDGRNSAGTTVASGLYVVHGVGPKLNMTNKIVVVK